MRVRALIGAAVLGLFALTSIPATAEAGHRHSRRNRHYSYQCRSGCGHRSHGYRSYGYRAYGYGSYGYRDYGSYGYVPRHHRYGRPVYYRRGWPIPRVGLFFRW